MEIFQGHEFIDKIINWLINNVEFDQHYFMQQFSKDSTLTLNQIIKLSRIQNDKDSKLEFLPQQPSIIIPRIEKQQASIKLPLIEQVHFPKLIKKKTKTNFKINNTQTNECIQLVYDQQFDQKEYKLRQKKKEEQQLKRRRMKQKEKLILMKNSNQEIINKKKNNNKEVIIQIFDYNGKLLWGKKTKPQTEKKNFQTKVNSQTQIINPKHQQKVISLNHKNQLVQNISNTIEKPKHQLFEKLNVSIGCNARSNLDCKFGKQIQIFQKTEKRFESLYQKQITDKRNSISKILPSLTSIKKKEQNKLANKISYSRFTNKIKYGQGFNIKSIFQLFSINNNIQNKQSRY